VDRRLSYVTGSARSSAARVRRPVVATAQVISYRVVIDIEPSRTDLLVAYGAIPDVLAYGAIGDVLACCAIPDVLACSAIADVVAYRAITDAFIT
jgi:hypothetical protein